MYLVKYKERSRRLNIIWYTGQRVILNRWLSSKESHWLTFIIMPTKHNCGWGVDSTLFFKRLQIHRHAFLPLYLCPILWIQSRVLLTDSNLHKKQATNSYISTHINNAHTWGEYFANNLWWCLRQAYIRHGKVVGPRNWSQHLPSGFLAVPSWWQLDGIFHQRELEGKNTGKITLFAAQINP